MVTCGHDQRMDSHGSTRLSMRTFWPTIPLVCGPQRQPDHGRINECSPDAKRACHRITSCTVQSPPEKFFDATKQEVSKVTAFNLGRGSALPSQPLGAEVQNEAPSKKQIGTQRRKTFQHCISVPSKNNSKRTPVCPTSKQAWYRNVHTFTRRPYNGIGGIGCTQTCRLVANHRQNGVGRSPDSDIST